MISPGIYTKTLIDYQDNTGIVPNFVYMCEETRDKHREEIDTALGIKIVIDNRIEPDTFYILGAD